MPDPTKPAIRPIASSPAGGSPPEEKVVCERCGSARVYRMHAVWRCADCGFKTDCCGW